MVTQQESQDEESSYKSESRSNNSAFPPDGMRRKDKEIIDRSEIDEIIRSCLVCRLALLVEDLPYILPVAFAYDGCCIYFHTAQAGWKITSLVKEPQVCFEFEHNVKVMPSKQDPCKWTFAFECVIGFGKVFEIEQEQQKIHALNCIMQQYSGPTDQFSSSAISQTRVWKINIDNISGKRSGGRKEI